ncbi:MAG: gamma-mobile-trio recombinase GmtY [Thalassotalea sp.]|nr:gamma-mobile-trio recombinase GmtY [Thalassotalea sp.]
MNVSSNRTSRNFRLPVIVIENQGILIDHLKYLLTNLTKSKSWQTNSVQSIRLFMEFISANKESYLSATEAFKGFSEALQYGTRDEKGNDDSGLYWVSLSNRRSRTLLQHLTLYADYLADKKNDESLRLNPFRKATKYEQFINLAAYYHKNKNAFLSHLRDDVANKEKSERDRRVKVKYQLSSTNGAIKAFPENRIQDLILNGFIKKGASPNSPIHKRCDLGNILITYLLVYGGLRVSEPFHIWLEDIMVDEGGLAIIKVHHPKEGFAKLKENPSRKESRDVHLQKNYGLLPRTDSLNRKNYYSGWKDPALMDGNFFYVNWFPESAGIEFYKLFKIYVEQVRFRNTSLMDSKGKLLLKEEAKHPFAFVSNSGAPKSYETFKRQFKKAVENINLTHKKTLGTTPHGLRHAYGRRLMNNGIDSTLITKALNHKSPYSKDVYTEADQAEIHKVFTEKSKELNGILFNV